MTDGLKDLYSAMSELVDMANSVQREIYGLQVETDTDKAQVRRVVVRGHCYDLQQAMHTVWQLLPKVRASLMDKDFR